MSDKFGATETFLIGKPSILLMSEIGAENNYNSKTGQIVCQRNGL